jgi:hypothetical protein
LTGVSQGATNSSWKFELQQRCERNVSVKTMDSFSFADGYALTLIAQYPKENWSDVTPNLSEDARKVAEAIIDPGKAQGEIKDAALNLCALAKKVRGAQA